MYFLSWKPNNEIYFVQFRLLLVKSVCAKSGATKQGS